MYPFLTIGIGQVVYERRDPLLTNVDQIFDKKSVLFHDDDVGKEAGEGFNYPNHAVSVAYQPKIIYAIQ